MGRHSQKNVTQLEKKVALRQMDHSINKSYLINGSHLMAKTQLEKCVTVRKWVPVGEISHTQKNG